MRICEAVKKLSDRTNRLAEKMVFVILSAITIIILMEVLFRYFPILDVSWSEELSKMLAVWLALVSASVALREGLHIGVRFFVDKIPSAKARKIIAIIINAIIFSFLIFLIVYGFIHTGRVAAQTAPGVKISMRWPYLAVPIGAFLISVQALTIVLNHILHFSEPKEIEAEPSKV